MIQILGSLVFNIWFYGWMVIIGVSFIPVAAVSREGAYLAIRIFLRFAFWGLRVFCGLRCEIRGKIPTGDVLVASKHHSFLDILMLASVVPRHKFVMKRVLVWAPLLGFYALRIGASPITRGKGWSSVQELAKEVEKRRNLDGQLVIFPQGTRVPPGVDAPYKAGAHLIYRTYDLPCIPAAANTGHFWPRRGVLRKPGVAVVEFLDPLPPGLDQHEFIAALRDSIEPASNRLSEEARKYGA